MALIKTTQEIADLKAGGIILADILSTIAGRVVPGVSTAELDELAANLMKEKNVKPSFKGFEGYPGVICASVNQDLVHGLPGKYKLQEGDIIGIDCGIWHKGLCTDMATTVAVGKTSDIANKLLDVTSKSLDIGLQTVRVGNTIGDYGVAVQDYVESKGFAIIRGLVGHGVGHSVHEEPRIPNFGEPSSGAVFQPGMVVALEPMVATGDYQIATAQDGWTISMTDKSLSAHFEVTIVVTESGFDFITPKVW